jgi:hypothetical protein
MIKRTVPLALVLLTLGASVAYAAPGKPKDRVQKATQKFVRHCTAGKDATRCQAAAKRVLERLEKIDTRIDARIAKLQQRCTGENAPPRCARSDEIVTRLHAVQARVRTVSEKLMTWLAGTTGASTGDGTTAPTGGTDNVDGLESLDDLAADLAAAEATAGN